MKFLISTTASRAEAPTSHLTGCCAEMRWFAALCLLLVQTGAHGFGIYENYASQSHQEITETALLEVTLEVCSAVAKAADKDLKEPSGSLTLTSVAVACEAEKSSKSFTYAIQVIKDANMNIYQDFYDSLIHRFGGEFTKAKKLITDGIAAVKANIKQQNYEAARERLGQLLHTLQDYYSHTDWVEMGNTNPNTNLIKVNADIGITAGGLNKDTLYSDHGHLHEQAANVAIAATSEVLQDIRAAAGDREFLRLMGIKKGKPLCFVIDTTGSMGNDIATVRTMTAALIDTKAGTDDEPSDYILVPFNDPDFGPLTRTTNADDFKSAINALRADGGGDFAEMSLSGLQLALTGSPPGSEIYVFTDASAKDAYLLGTVRALIERTRSVVTVLITGSLGLRRRRETHDHGPGSVYKLLAESSGGQAIQVTKEELVEVTSIITETSSSSVVNLLQASGNAGKHDNFTFSVDDSVKNLTMYITGRSLTFTITSPSGVTQSSADMTGPLVVSSSTVGNFQIVKLNTQVGVWKVEMVSTSAYNLKVVGESLIDFLLTFLEEHPSGGFQVISNRPKSGENATLRVTITGSDSTTVTDVILVELYTFVAVHGSVEDRGKGVFYVRFDTIPSSDFVVLVKGQTNSSSSSSRSSALQRQSSSIKASAVSVSATLTNSVAEPGVPFPVPFSVATSGMGGTFTITATNDKGYSLSFPSNLSLTGGSANGTGTLTAPSDTPSGTDVTLTIEATSPDMDTNYVVLRLTVFIPVTDVTAPVCQLPNVTDHCSNNCAESMWTVSLQVRDDVYGTGIDKITIRGGDGTLNTTMLPDNITLLTYHASCCSPDVEIIAVDKVGNAQSCSFSVWKTTTTMSNTRTTTTTMPTTHTTTTTMPTTRTTTTTMPTTRTTTTTMPTTLTTTTTMPTTHTTTTTMPTTRTTATTMPTTHTTTTTTTMPTTHTTTPTMPTTHTTTTTATSNNTNWNTPTIVTTPSMTTSAAVPLSTGAAQLSVLFLSAIILSVC